MPYLDARIAALEAKVCPNTVAGTAISRVLNPKEGEGVQWCLSLGAMHLPKRFYFGPTILACLLQAENDDDVAKPPCSLEEFMVSVPHYTPKVQETPKKRPLTHPMKVLLRVYDNTINESVAVDGTENRTAYAMIDRGLLEHKGERKYSPGSGELLVKITDAGIVAAKLLRFQL